MQEVFVTLENNTKLFECEEYFVAFNSQNLTLKLLPKDILDYVINNTNDHQDKVLTLSSHDNPLMHFNNTISNNVIKESINPTIDEKPTIDRLTLNVSNTCNMACRYCYANKGVYYSTGLYMNQVTALNAVNFASKTFSRINYVDFFGGEPTLNLPIIEMICNYINFLYDRGILSILPKFGLTTNCFNVSAHLLRLLSEYNFNITISLDGPKEIHDLLRITKDNRGTYDNIVENIKKITSIGIVPEFECTYTNEHYRRGFSLTELMDFFYDTFECHVLHCPIVIANPNSPWFISHTNAVNLYTDAIKYSVENLTRGIPKSISIATRFLHSLESHTPICHYCPAGKSSFTINADGKIFPCFMLMYDNRFECGNVNDESIECFNEQLYDPIIEDADKLQNPICQDCWGQSLCFGCLGEDLAQGQRMINRSVIPFQSTLCDFKRSMMETFLLTIVESYLQ